MSGTLVHVQQRRVVRRSLRIDCQIVRERDFRLVGSRGLDVSPEGMLVMLQEPVLTGEPVVVSFRLPRSDFWFDSLGTVARVSHGRRPGDLGRAFGLQFEGLEPDVAVFLRHALRGVPPPVPAREPRVDYAETIRRAAMS